MTTITDTIKRKLNEMLKPSLLELIDHSAAHEGHEGNSGGGHYHLTLVSDAFTDKSLVQRHQLVYQALDDMMKEQIHALSINALTPDEHNIGNFDE